MLIRVVLARLPGMMRSLVMMAVRHMSMVTGFLMVPSFMVLRRGAVVLSGILVMFRGLAVMISGLFRHVQTSAVIIRAACHNRVTRG